MSARCVFGAAAVGGGGGGRDCGGIWQPRHRNWAGGGGRGWHAYLVSAEELDRTTWARKLRGGLKDALQMLATFAGLRLSTIVHCRGFSAGGTLECRHTNRGGAVMYNGIAASPDGSRVLAAECAGRAVLIFSRDTATGDLTLRQRMPLLLAPDNIVPEASAAVEAVATTACPAGGSGSSDCDGGGSDSVGGGADSAASAAATGETAGREKEAYIIGAVALNDFVRFAMEAGAAAAPEKVASTIRGAAVRLVVRPASADGHSGGGGGDGLDYSIENVVTTDGRRPGGLSGISVGIPLVGGGYMLGSCRDAGVLVCRPRGSS
ncbi:unnamed protein product [Phaeothamnion confervicola]